MRRLAVAALLCLVTLFSLRPALGANDVSLAWDKLSAVTFPIYGAPFKNPISGRWMQAICTAFVFEYRYFQTTQDEAAIGLLATAGHCAQGGAHYFDTRGRAPFNYLAMGWTGNADFAVGIIPNAAAELGLVVLGDNVRTTPLAPGEMVLTMGYGDGQLREVVGRYIVHDPDQGDYPDYFGTDEFAVVSGIARPGASGSAVVDTEGRLVGILTHSNDEKFVVTRIATVEKIVDDVAPPWFPPL